MKGILLISHGKMAEGTADTCRFIMGDSLAQLDFCCLENGESPEHYGQRLKEKIASVDTGEGVMIFCDLYGGTPCKEAIMLLNDRMDLIAGMNFPILLEAMTQRISGEVNIDALIAGSAAGIIDVKKAAEQAVFGEGDE